MGAFPVVWPAFTAPRGTQGQTILANPKQQTLNAIEPIFFWKLPLLHPVVYNPWVPQESLDYYTLTTTSKALSNAMLEFIAWLAASCVG